jgi:hypothetical protein
VICAFGRRNQKIYPVDRLEYPAVRPPVKASIAHFSTGKIIGKGVGRNIPRVHRSQDFGASRGCTPTATTAAAKKV